MRYVVLTILVFSIASLHSVSAHATDSERESLRGLPGVAVTVEDIATDIQTDGLSMEEIGIAVDLILRSNGIRVLSQPERFETEASPYLYITVLGFKDGSVYSLCIEVQLRQIVSLTSGTNHKMFVSTWSRNSLLSVGANTLHDVISGSIEPKAKDFANDFLTVNPR